MATEIPPLDNSFCNYADDTPGGHFETNAAAQLKRAAPRHLRPAHRAAGRLEAATEKRPTNTINRETSETPLS